MMDEKSESVIDRKPCVVALGMFDGMHLGHRRVIEETVHLAREMRCESVVYTFQNHPRSVFSTEPFMLMDAEERRNIMYELGADIVDMIPFTRELADFSPEEFIRQLIGKYDVKCVVAGEDYSFGKFGAGRINDLITLGSVYGFKVVVIPFVRLYGEKVSSTRIREALVEGNDELADELMGKKHSD